MRTEHLKSIALSLLFIFTAFAAQSQCTATITGGGALCADGSITLSLEFEGGGSWTVVYAFNGADQPAIITSENPYPLVVSQPGEYTLISAESSACGTATVTGSASVNDGPALDGGLGITPGCEGELSTLTALWGNTGTPPMEFLWNDGFTGQEQDVEPYVTYTVTITDAAGCTSVGATQGYEAIIECGITQIGDMNCVGDEVSLVAECTSSVPIGGYLWSTGGTTEGIAVNQPGTYSVTVTNFAGCEHVFTIDIPMPVDCGAIKGKIAKDDIANCQFDMDDTGLSGWMVRANGTQEFYGFSNANGEYTVNVFPGDYEVELIPPMEDYWEACQPIFSTTIEDVSDVDTIDFVVEELVECPYLTVDIGTWFFRRCFETTTTVDYCNLGTQDAEAALIEVTLAPELEVLSASIPFTGPVGDTYTFEVGDVAIGECGEFTIQMYTSCNSVMEQTLCMEAHIYPDSICTPFDSLWSGASIELLSECDGDSLYFTITNVGTGDMDEPLQYIVIQDGVMMLNVLDGPELSSSESITIAVPANGATYVLQAPQVEGHPGFSMPLLAIEGCGVNSEGEFSTGYVLQYPEDDADHFVSIHCGEVLSSFDPNDKQGFPVGYGDQHFIEPGQELEYLIRFQNTGNDTAFTVRIEDAISDKLDLGTLRPGAASHAYEIFFRGNTVVFLFENILLPDSNTNEPLSHGFVKFKIQQHSGNEISDVIENTADIYFDFNEPIVTNTTLHQLGDDFIVLSSFESSRPDLQLLVYPNPASGETALLLHGDLPPGEITLSLHDLTGRAVQSHRFRAPVCQFDVSNLPTGIYFFEMKMEGVRIGQGKLAVE